MARRSRKEMLQSKIDIAEAKIAELQERRSRFSRRLINTTTNSWILKKLRRKKLIRLQWMNS